MSWVNLAPFSCSQLLQSLFNSPIILQSLAAMRSEALTRICIALLGLLPILGLAQPVNDDCANAITIPIPNGGYGFGQIVGDTVDMTGAGTQLGEYFSPGVPNGKSVWYRFSVPTTREVRILLTQDSTNATPQNAAGWSLYRTSSCLPGIAELVDPPIFQIEGFTHACLREGEYLIQVGADFGVNNELIINLDVAPPSAVETLYDFAADAYDFQVVSGYGPSTVQYEVGCQSVFAGELLCPDSSYTKSTWHVFTTDNLVDYLRIFAREYPFNGSVVTPRNFGFQLYLGDVRQDSTGLMTVGNCRQMVQTSSNNYEAVVMPCDLLPNTTYSVQLLFPTEYFGNLEVGINEIGSSLTQGPNPATLPASHTLGVLNAIGTTNLSDYMACNAVMSDYACGTNIPDTLSVGSYEYDLNWWATFEITNEQNMRAWISNYYSQPTPYIRIFSGDATSDCNLPIVAEGTGTLDLPCLPVGTYSVQVLGTINLPGYPEYYTSLGKQQTLNIEVLQADFNAYTLATNNEFEDINGGNPLQPGVTYTSTQNWFDCQTTIMPAGDSCSSGGYTNDRAMYRIFTIGQNGYVRLSQGAYNMEYRLFRGDASSLPISGGIINGLTDQTCCQSLYYAYGTAKVCVTPGTYTLVTYGSEGDINSYDQPQIFFDTLPSSPYFDPNLAQDIDTLAVGGSSVVGTPVTFTCEDNPLTILGNAPCHDATKQVYREFYLEDSASLRFLDQTIYTPYSDRNITHRLFSGRISNGSLTSLVWDCFTSYTMSSCDFLEPGWYTVVSYGDGETYTNPEYCSPERGEAIGDQTSFTISINNPYNDPLFNTFAKAENVNGGTPLEWKPRLNLGHTDTIPKLDTLYTLGTEYFNCENDLPFPTGITACDPSQNRVSYRVFTLAKPSFVRMDRLTNGYYGGSSRLYEGDITAQAPPFTVNEDCFGDDFWKCMPAGTYTLVSFFTDSYIGSSVTPRIMVDSLGTSKYDHAAGAYNFGNIPLNGTEYLGAPGSPLDAYGRPGSNDFFFCSTGAYDTEPKDVCPTGSQTIPYSVSMPTSKRQTLWYTFEVTGPGSVDISVYGRTPGRPTNLPFAVYRVPNNQIPLIDSTTANLELIVSNQGYYCWNSAQTVNIFRDPCSAITTDRYVVLVDRYAYQDLTSSGVWPNQQIEVGVQFSNIPGTSVLYDHYSQANRITGNPTVDCDAPYNDTLLSQGTFTGCEGNLTCATQDATDQNSCGAKTIWYRVDLAGSGQMRLNFTRTDNGTTGYNADDIQLYRETTPGDSSSSGLQRIPLNQQYLNTNPDFPGYHYWGSTCYTSGTYYIMITGCNFPNATVYPRIWLDNYPGDLCSDNIEVEVSGTGTFQDSGRVDCWTMGNSPGEDQPELGCAGTPIGKKSGWFHVNITDTARMDLDISLIENTTATSLQTQYRVGNGSCDLMTFENCVDDAFITLNLKCRQDSGLWIQVILPEEATGMVTLNVEATPSPDQNCEPVNPFQPSASFDFIAGCEGDPVQFINQSSTGDSLSYLWDFGDGFTSTYQQPSHVYAVADTYLVTLVVSQDTLADTTIRPVVIYPVPQSGFTTLMNVIAGNPLLFTNTSTNTLPAATYYWNFCSGGSFCSADVTSFSGANPPTVIYDVPGVYEICLTVTNGNCVDTFCQTVNVVTPNFYGGGPYDGFDTEWLEGCDTLNFFAGGPYDGFDTEWEIPCDTLNFFTGGPYDGFDMGIGDSACLVDSMVSLWAGGPYDGAGEESILLGCEEPPSLWAGGPFDGAAEALIVSNCQSPNFFAGGPYDGFDAEFDDANCQTENFFTGGPYDGFDMDLDECVQINFFTGGPYDGEDRDTRGSGGLITTDLTACVGDTVTLQASGPTNWYYTETGNFTFASGVATVQVPNVQQTFQLYVEDQCNGGRESVTVHVIDTMVMDFAFTPGCQTTATFFSNLTPVPGASQPTIGADVTTFGTMSNAPNFNQLTFSGGNTYTFANIHDGTANQNAWTSNNGSPGTVWAQWRYFTPKAVDRIVLWNDGNYPGKIPTEARLYYSNGGPWNLVKVFTAAELQTTQFDSGPLCETRNHYAQRWKLELDVEEANAPYIREFQAYAHEATISGAVEWDFGDGSPAVVTSNPVHYYPAPGLYDVTMRLPDDCGCPSEVVRTIEVTNCAILAQLEHELNGWLTEELKAELYWHVEGDFPDAVLEKFFAGQWIPLETFYFTESNLYSFTDNAPIMGQPNLYRVKVEHQGETVYSNQISLMPELSQTQVLVYPNPADVEPVTVELQLPDDAVVEVRLLNSLGQDLGQMFLGGLESGIQQVSIPVEQLAEGQYFLRVNVNEYPYSLRLLVK